MAVEYVNIEKEIKKREFILDTDDYEEGKSVTGLIALARNIQTLLFLEPGSYPNNPKMGINISSYSFEIFDDKTIDRMRFDIINQLEEYIPTSDVNDIVIQEIKGLDSYENLVVGILFILNRSINGKNDFIILLKKSKKTSKIISEIII